MICFDKITEIYSIVDEFCKDFDKTTEPFLIGTPLKREPLKNEGFLKQIFGKLFGDNE